MQPMKLKFVITNNKIAEAMISKKTLRLFPITAFIILLTSCDPLFNCLDGNGVLEVEDRFVTEFLGVVNQTSFNVEIVSDSVYSVRVTADANLLDEIKTSVRSGNLIVDTENDRCLSSDHKILVEVRMPFVDLVELSGSGNIDAYDFTTSNLEVRNSGSGDIDLVDIVSTSEVDITLTGSGNINMYGKAVTGSFVLSGSGDIFAQDYKMDRCKAINSGSGDIYCYASEYLDANVSGSGDIIYSGNPAEVVQEDDGSGSIRSRN
jgi:hypothetical protein